MENIKEVKVSLMPQDEKKLTRTTTRKRRVKGGELAPANVKAADAEAAATELATGDAPPGVVIPGEPAAVPSIDTRGHSWVPLANNKTMPNVEKQVTPAPGIIAANVAPTVGPPLSGGSQNHSGNPTVKLGGKKNFPYTVPSAASIPGAPKILPTKRKSGGAPAIVATRKKEKLIIHTPKSQVQHSAAKQTRKFKERRINITVRSGNRAATRRIKEKVEALPISQVRRMLLRKGVLKPGNIKTPEPMLRSMLRDYMLLHNAD